MTRPDDPARRRRFEAMFDAHYDAVRRYARRRTAAASADDVVAEVFAIAWRRLDRVPRDEPLPWLYRVAANVLANERRAAGRDAERAGRAAASAQASSRDPADAFAERDAVLGALGALGERDREALRLVAWEGLSLADAARAAGVTRPAFAMRLHRARGRLQARLDPAREDGDTPLHPRPLENRA